MSNVKEVIAGKVETLNTLKRFVEGLQNESSNPTELLMVLQYMESMKKGYKEAFELVERMGQHQNGKKKES